MCYSLNISTSWSSLWNTAACIVFSCGYVLSIAAVFSEHSGLNRLEYIGRLVSNGCRTLVLQQEYQINTVPNMHEYVKSLKTLRKGCAWCSTAQRTTKPAWQINSAIPRHCYQLLGTYIKTAEFAVSSKMRSISPHCTCRISTTFEQTLFVGSVFPPMSYFI